MGRESPGPWKGSREMTTVSTEHEFTIIIGTADGGVREPKVVAPDGLMETALNAVRAEMTEGESLMAILSGPLTVILEDDC